MYENKIITGKIIKGRNRSQEDLFNPESNIKKMLGLDIYPGTLNLIINEPLLLNTKYGIPIDIQKKRYVWRLDNPRYAPKIFLYRWIGCPMHVVEIISTHHIKKFHNLKNGNNFNINLNSKYIFPINKYKYIVWFLLWKGRVDWYYNNENYKNFVYKNKILKKLASQVKNH